MQTAFAMLRRQDNLYSVKRRTWPAVLAVAALGLALAAGSGDGPARSAPPPLEPFDPKKVLSDAECAARIREVREGLTPKQVEVLLGPPKRVARQILYPCYLEQWVYDAPFNLRVEFRCPHGQEAHVQSVHEFTSGGR
jgi:hypothetical protein